MRSSIRYLAPAVLALALFVLNNLAAVGGWMAPPPDHVPAFASRGADLAVYQSWLAGFEHETKLPDYQAPWATERAFFNALPFLIARVARAFSLDPLLCYHLFHALFYVLAVFALFYAVRTFTETRHEARWAWTIILLSVPVTSLLIVPFWAASLVWTPVPSLPGLGDYVYWTSDGLLHGISASIFVTFGTATTIAAFAWLARYLQTRRAAFLLAACTTTALSAFIHPFEAIVICAAGCLTLLTASGTDRRRRFLDSAALGAAALGGALPMALALLDSPWLQAAAAVNQWKPPNPARLLVALGLPVLAAVAMLPAAHRSLRSGSDRLLQAWTLCAIAGVYVPWIRWSQHLLDGVLYGTALLLVRQAGVTTVARRLKEAHPRLVGVLLATLITASLIPAIVFRWHSFVSGRQADPDRLFSGVTPRDERDLVRWLREHAESTDLVLAPPEHAPWLAVVPMHSFASHYVFSLTYDAQRTASANFFAGRLAAHEATGLLRDYGVRFLVVPETSPALAYVREVEPRGTLGTLRVYEFPNAMKPYAATPAP